MRSVRSVVRPLIAVFLAVSCVLLVAATVQASVQVIQQRSAGTDPAGSHSLTISIDAVSPQFATSNSTVTVSGTLFNDTGSAIPGITVQAQTSSQWFSNRSAMTSFAAGGEYPQAGALASVGTPDELTAPVANGATVHWSVSFQAGLAYGANAGVFGVYPVLVEAASADSASPVTGRTFLPFWPGGGSSAPKKLQVAWVWPLIGTPQQGGCARTLATNSLAGALAANGRLSTLLQAGQQWGSGDELTWAIDPALLSDAKVMTRSYFTGGNSACSDRTVENASGPAASWLSALQTGTAGESAFLTPYANVDAAALSHAGLDADLRTAYQVGDEVAAKILPGTFGTSADGTGNGTTLAAAWPADGAADAGVMTSLARDGGVNTVVLSSDELATSTPPYDDALARTKTAAGTSVSVLLADSGITSILGSATAGSPAAARFAVTQDFLAQTAMIVAEGPNLGRSLVVAPPPGWDPSLAEATDLLSLTHSAPWLSATGLGTLASAAKAAAVHVSSLPAKRVSHAELSDGYTDQIQSLDNNLDLFKNLLYRPSEDLVSSLDEAVAVTESSAWRGDGSPGGWLALTEFADYLNNQEQRVKMLASTKILLAGTSGHTPVSVTNGLDVPVQVRVEASAAAGSSLRIDSPAQPLKVNPGMTGTIPLSIHSATIGTTTMQLELVTSSGSPLPWTAHPLSVEVTRFGRAILVIIFGALGVLVLASVLRLRRKRRGDGRHGGGTDDSAAYDSAAGDRVEAGGTG